MSVSGAPRDHMAAARCGLLDAIVALRPHQAAVVVVGAQAVYLRSQDADFAVAAHTTDGDLAIDPDSLGDAPPIDEAMTSAGFVLRRDIHGAPQPGVWQRTVTVGGRSYDIPVDLIVPAGLDRGARTHRGARIPPHPKTAAMRTSGLEAAVVDQDRMRIAALDPTEDPRSVDVRVAGVAALLIAKAHKIHDRLTIARRRPDRLSDKDAGDVLRLMSTSNARAVGVTFRELVEHSGARPAALAGAAMLRTQFGVRRGPGVRMAVRALAAGGVSEDRLEDLSVAYVRTLLADLPPR